MGRARVTVDREKLRELWCAGVTSKVIGARLGCSYPTVNRIAEDMGLPKRKPGTLELVERAPRAVRATPKPAAPVVSDPVEAAIMSARGYADLAAIAEAHGLALSEVQRRFHKVRG